METIIECYFTVIYMKTKLKTREYQRSTGSWSNRYSEAVLLVEALV